MTIFDRARGGLALFAIGACVSATALAAEPAQIPSNAFHLPLVRQQTDYSCGPAALLSVLKYWHRFNGVEQDLYAMLKTTSEQGTHPLHLTEVAQKFMLKAEFRQNLEISDLQKALNHGVTVILDLQAWADEKKPVNWATDWEDGHYINLIAMDSEYIYAQDPSADDAYVYLPISEFLSRWHDDELEDGKRVEYQHSAVLVHGRHRAKLPIATSKLIRLN